MTILHSTEDLYYVAFSTVDGSGLKFLSQCRNAITCFTTHFTNVYTTPL